MADIFVCEGATTAPSVAGHPPVCDSGYLIVPYVEPTDSTAIYSQLVALNEFDPERVAWIIVICLSTFIVGFVTGVVVKLMRRL